MRASTPPPHLNGRRASPTASPMVIGTAAVSSVMACGPSVTPPPAYPPLRFCNYPGHLSYQARRRLYLPPSSPNPPQPLLLNGDPHECDQPLMRLLLSFGLAAEERRYTEVGAGPSTPSTNEALAAPSVLQPLPPLFPPPLLPPPPRPPPPRPPLVRDPAAAAAAVTAADRPQPPPTGGRPRRRYWGGRSRCRHGRHGRRQNPAHAPRLLAPPPTRGRKPLRGGRVPQSPSSEKTQILLYATKVPEEWTGAGGDGALAPTRWLTTSMGARPSTEMRA